MTESTLIQVYRGFNSLMRFDVNILLAVSLFQEKMGKWCRKVISIIGEKAFIEHFRQALHFDCKICREKKTF